MKLFNKLYLVMKNKPYKTDTMEYDFKKFIIKKKDKVNELHPMKDKDKITKNIEYINKYGNIIEPIQVSSCSFSNRLIIRGNISGFYALKESNIKSIPVRFVS